MAQKEKTPMRCGRLECMFLYDPTVGNAEFGIPPGLSFTDLPEDWCCPVCGGGKEKFRTDPKETWRCGIQECLYLYDPSVGDPKGGIPPGVCFENLPEEWHCPLCGAGKKLFRQATDTDETRPDRL